MLIKKALVATNLSPSSQRLSSIICELERSGLEKVFLVSVADISRLGTAIDSHKNELEEKLSAEKEEILAAAEGSLEIEVLAPIGYPAPKIQEIAENNDVDIIVIGTHRRGLLREWLLGSTTFSVISSSRIPVLVEKLDSAEDGDNELEFIDKKLEKVLIPIDTSEPSEKTVEMIKSSDLHIDTILLASILESSTDQRGHKHQREDLLEKTQNQLEARGYTVETHLRIGDVTENILRLADEIDVSLICIPSRKDGSLRALLTGSKAASIARRAEQPVLFIPFSPVSEDRENRYRRRGMRW